MKRALRNGALLPVLILSGCAHVDTGQADYRIADVPVALTEKDLNALPGNKCSTDIKVGCDPILPSRVLRRYMPPAEGWAAFENEQVYSIAIEQGIIGSNILEGKILGQQFGRTAEIAILANVFEFASSSGEAGARRFVESGEIEGTVDDPSDVELKLIYFSDDVKREQTLNFSNVPLRPKTAYGGGSIGIQLVVMEVDAQAGPVSALLKTLAKLGQQSLPVPGEAKDILFDLGESLLTGSKDDRLLEYRFVLSAPTEDDRAVQATFAPGRYVIRRGQDRKKEMGWADLRLDHNTGRLLVSQPAGGFAQVSEDLYLVLNIRRYPEGTAPEYYANADWSAFRGALQAAADAKAAPLDKVNEQLMGLSEKLRSKDIGDRVKLKWANARSRLDVYSGRYAANIAAVDVSTCGVTNNELQRRLDIAEREAQDALRKFIAEYQAGLAQKRRDAAGAVIGDEFAETDRDELVRLAATWFMPWAQSGADQASFATSAAFEPAYVAASPSKDILAVAIAASAAKAPANPTCQTLTTK